MKLLARLAEFRVRLNCVLGSSPPAEAIAVARTAIELGFDVSTSLVRDSTGALIPLAADARRAYETIRNLGERAPAYLSDDFTVPLIETGRTEWKCRAGARTFHVCEDGLVHLCSPRTGNPGIPIAQYTEDHIRRAFHAKKSCAPTCPIAYAHHASRFDGFRSQRDVWPDSLAAEPLVQLRIAR